MIMVTFKYMGWLHSQKIKMDTQKSMGRMEKVTPL